MSRSASSKQSIKASRQGTTPAHRAGHGEKGEKSEQGARSESVKVQYAELHCISNYTFLRGASHPEELVHQAAALGYQALALTDECSMAGVVKAHVAAMECGLKLIVGSEFELSDRYIRLVLLATNRASYGEIC